MSHWQEKKKPYIPPLLQMQLQGLQYCSCFLSSFLLLDVHTKSYRWKYGTFETIKNFERSMQTKFEPMGTNRNPDKRLSRGWMIPAPVKVSTQSKHGDGKQCTMHMWEASAVGEYQPWKSPVGVERLWETSCRFAKIPVVLLLCKRGQNQHTTKSLNHSKGKRGINFPLFHDIMTDVVAWIGLQWGCSCCFIWWWRCLLRCWGRWLVSLV